MLLMKLLLKAALPDTPYWIIQQMAKTEFKRREVEKSLSGQRYVNNHKQGVGIIIMIHSESTIIICKTQKEKWKRIKNDCGSIDNAVYRAYIQCYRK